MHFQSLFEQLPEIAEKETRSIMLLKDNRFGLPEDEYGFIELFCNTPDCDCRRVFFNVFSRNKKQFEAVIFWGWEKKNFYREWMHDTSGINITKDLIGPGLNVGSPQSAIAGQLLKAFAEILLKDYVYTERVKKHYQLFKKKINPNKPFIKQ